MISMLGEMERLDATFAVQAICCASRIGTATLLERLP